jgi:hypothetical protein
MSRLERFSLHLATLAMGATGLLYGWLKYFHQRAGDFGPEPYPLQAWAQHGHVLAGPLMVFALGVMVKGHVMPVLRAGTVRGRLAGLWTAWMAAPMVLSGYALQVCVEAGTRKAVAWVHGPLALVFLAGYGIHVLGFRGE